MKVNDYIQKRFQTFGIDLSEADLFDVTSSAGIPGSNEMDDVYRDRLSYGIALFIPALLLRASTISESGFSMSWNIQGIKDYYSFLCKKLGIKDELSDKPKVAFL